MFHQEADGTFAMAQEILNAARSSGTTVVGDVDGDGDNDLISIDSSQITTLLNNGTELEPPLPVAVGPERLETSLDIDGDGQDELLGFSGRGERVSYSILRFNAATHTYIQADLDLKGLNRVFQVGDLNGDGRDDLRGASGDAFIELMGSEEGLEANISFHTYFPFDFVVFTDPNGDGVVKPVFNSSRDEVSYAEDTLVPAGNFPSADLVWQNSWYPTTDLWGDFDGDGKDDWAAVGPSGIYVSFGGQDHRLVHATNTLNLDRYTSILAIDVSGRDQRDSIVSIGDEFTTIIDAYEGDVSTYPSPASIRELPIETYDVDGDNVKDLLWWNSEIGAIEWAPSVGDRPRAELLKVGSLVNDVHFADIDLDGTDEFVVTGDGVTIYSRTREGTYRIRQHVLRDVEVDAVASGDIDDDGDIDLVIASTMFTAVLRSDDFGFFKITDQIGPVVPLRYRPRGGLFVKDVDNDGALDIAVGSTWYQNQKTDEFDDRFVPQPQPQHTQLFDEIVDANGDGIFEAFDRRNRTLSSLQDIEIPDSSDVDGFIPHTNNLSFAIQQAFWADMNGDTVQEIVAHDGEAIWLFERVLDGWLPTKLLEDSISTVLVSDFDQNGVDEIYYEGNSLAWIRQEDGLWVGTVLQGDTSYDGLAAVDVNQDGDDDLLTFTGSIYYRETVDRLPFRFSNHQRSTRIVERTGHSFDTADFNHDGLLDGVQHERRGITIYKSLIESGDESNRLTVLLATEDREEIPMTIADVNRDGWADIVIVVDSQLQWFENSQGTFVESSVVLTTTDVADATSLKARDIDGDGLVDFVIEGNVQSTFLLNRGETYQSLEFPGTGFVFKDGEIGGEFLHIGLHGQVHVSTLDDSLNHETTTISHRMPIIGSGDFDNDGEVEFVMRGGVEGSSLVVGDATNGSGDMLAGEFSAAPVVTIDVNSDGWLDIVQISRRSVIWSENIRGESFRQREPVDTGRRAKLVDVDGDGNADIIAQGSDGDTWIRNLGETFAKPQVLFPGGRVRAVIDGNNDGNLDFVVSFADEMTKVFLGLDEQAIPRESIDLGVSWSKVIVTDLDGNGYADIVSVLGDWLRNGPDGFDSPRTLIADAKIERAKDFDGDGDIDLLVDDFGAWFENTGEAEFGERNVTSSAEQTAEQLLAIDVNGDAVLEVIGLGYREGARLLPVSYDFDSDGRLNASDVNLIHGEIVRGDGEELRFDVNNDGRVSPVDGVMYVETHLESPIGDSNLDGAFGTADLVSIFQEAKYEKSVEATWADGDWDFNGRFDSSDLVLAFRRSRYIG
ncbi:FG-GAP repeat domain-containing protein [Planctomycetota bacterium]